jgi:hypothetical protein
MKRRRLSPQELARLERETGLAPSIRSEGNWHKPHETPTAPLGERLRMLAVALGLVALVTGIVGFAIAPSQDGHIKYLDTPSLILVCVGFGPLALAAAGFVLY